MTLGGSDDGEEGRTDDDSIPQACRRPLTASERVARRHKPANEADRLPLEAVPDTSKSKEEPADLL